MNKQQLKWDIETLEGTIGVIPYEEMERDALERVIAYLKQQLTDGWIPCKSKLPDKVHMKYLVTMKHKHFNEYYIDCRNLYSDYQFEFENNFERHNWDVVAWQPLPEPYKEDKDAERSNRANR